MNRLLALLTVGLVAGVAVADLPPPAGFKRIKVVHKITTDKDHPLYAFYTVVPGLKEATAVKFDTKTPIEINRPGLIGSTELVAVPVDSAKKYGSEKEFLTAVAEGKVDGEIRSKTTFFCRGTAKDTFKGDTQTIEYKLDKIDAKDGLVLTKKAAAGSKDGVEDDSDTPVAVSPAPRGGMWVAGLAAFAAVMLGGFWLAGRTRRKV